MHFPAETCILVQKYDYFLLKEKPFSCRKESFSYRKMQFHCKKQQEITGRFRAQESRMPAYFHKKQGPRHNSLRQPSETQAGHRTKFTTLRHRTRHRACIVAYITEDFSSKSAICSENASHRESDFLRCTSLSDGPTTTTTIFEFISRGPIFHFWGTTRCRAKCPLYTVEHRENTKIFHLMCHQMPF